MSKSKIKVFFERLGFDFWGSDCSVKPGEYLGYVLKIENYDFKIEMEILSRDSREHKVSFIPINHQITSEMVDFIQALRFADVSQLWDDIEYITKEYYATIREGMCNSLKNNTIKDALDIYKKGKVLKSVTISDYMDDTFNDLISDMKERVGIGRGDIYILPDTDKYVMEGILEAWKDMTGRDDLYCGKDAYDNTCVIYSK